MQRNGIHHVTAIAGPARRNLDFYTRVLGLHLVKKTVNFDDPGTYHFYYGDAAGQPGTILTFFPWEHAAGGRRGVGFAQETAFRVPEEAIGFWAHRFIQQGVAHEAPARRFGQTVLPFTDPDGMSLALVGTPGAGGEPAWTTAEIGIEEAIRGFAGVTFLLEDAARTGAILADLFGFAEIGSDGPLVRFAVEGQRLGGTIDIRVARGFLPGRMGAGAVHHVAFRAATDADQAAMVRRLAENHGLRATEPLDRTYFRSVYFREPGGILFEIASDDPGFAVDEPADSLGQRLKLPAFLEPRRREIEARLPALAEAEANP